ncbi:MAG: DUF4145 domain-containing protein [Candidatus Bathyanammoxibius sp.]
MKCPHCLESFHEENPDGTSAWGEKLIGDDYKTQRSILWIKCPACEKFIVYLQGYNYSDFTHEYLPIDGTRVQIFPRGTARSSLPPEVPEVYASNYRDACNVLYASAKASAALSRRCLQHLLREKAGVKHSSLANEVDEVIKSGELPSYLSKTIDALRNYGNFASHPIKNTSTGEIIDVEPGEAEWLLETLEELFDFYFVKPEKLKQKREALDKKLKDAGKPPMK